MRSYLLVFGFICLVLYGTADFISSGRLLRFVDKNPERPGTAAVLFTLASYYNLFNKPAQANEYYGRIVEHFPDSSRAEEAQYELASNYYKLKEYAKSTAEYDKFLEKHPASKYAVSVHNHLKMTRGN